MGSTARTLKFNNNWAAKYNSLIRYFSYHILQRRMKTTVLVQHFLHQPMHASHATLHESFAKSLENPEEHQCSTTLVLQEKTQFTTAEYQLCQVNSWKNNSVFQLRTFFYLLQLHRTPFSCLKCSAFSLETPEAVSNGSVQFYIWESLSRKALPSPKAHSIQLLLFHY